jgi:Tfp pilus assembly protein PilE
MTNNNFFDTIKHIFGGFLMNKKGFSLIAVLVAVILLFVVLQIFLNKYMQTVDSSVATAKKVSSGKLFKSKNKKHLPTQIPVNIQLSRKLDFLLHQQNRYFAQNRKYATELKTLEVPEAIIKMPDYTFGLDNNKDGWVVWTKKIKSDKNKKDKFYLGKNIKTRRLCCQDIDKGACKALNWDNIPCTEQGWTLDSKNATIK